VTETKESKRLRVRDLKRDSQKVRAEKERGEKGEQATEGSKGGNVVIVRRKGEKPGCSR